MPEPSALAEVLADLGRALAGTRWYLFGAQAVSVYAAPRLSADVDVTVGLEPDDAERLSVALEAAGFTPRVTDVAAFVARTRVLPVAHEVDRDDLLDRFEAELRDAGS